MNTNAYNVEAILKAIELAGGVAKLSLKVGVSYQTVLNWKNQRAIPSHLNCAKIEAATNGQVKRDDILHIKIPSTT